MSLKGQKVKSLEKRQIATVPFMRVHFKAKH